MVIFNIINKYKIKWVPWVKCFFSYNLRYGDFVPSSKAAKALMLVWILTGLVIMGLITGVIASGMTVGGFDEEIKLYGTPVSWIIYAVYGVLIL